MNDLKYSFLGRLVDTFPLCKNDDHVQSNCLKLMNSTLQFIKTNKSDLQNGPTVTIPTEMLLNALKQSLSPSQKPLTNDQKELPPQQQPLNPKPKTPLKGVIQSNKTGTKQRKRVTIREPEVSSMKTISKKNGKKEDGDSFSDTSQFQSRTNIPPDESVTETFGTSSFGNITLLDKYGDTVASFFGNI